MERVKDQVVDGIAEALEKSLITLFLLAVILHSHWIQTMRSGSAERVMLKSTHT